MDKSEDSVSDMSTSNTQKGETTAASKIGASPKESNEPLLMTPILNKVLSFMPVSTLKNCRLVCIKWAEASLPFLHRKATFVVSAGQLKSLPLFLSSIHLSLDSDKSAEKAREENQKDFYDKYHLINIPNLPSSPPINFLGRRIKKLTVSIENFSDDFQLNENFPSTPSFEDYCCLLNEKCPQMEDLLFNLMEKPNQLSLSLSPLSLKSKSQDEEAKPQQVLCLKKIRISGEWIIPPSTLLDIIDLCPDFNSLQITDLDTGNDQDYPTKLFEYLTSLPTGEQNVGLTSKLTSLTLGEITPLDSSAMYHFTKISTWNLRHLEAFLDPTVTDDEFTRLLTCIKATIQTLHIQMYSTTFGWQFLQTDSHESKILQEKSWLLPVGMEKLEKLTVCSDREDVLSTVLWSAVKLPALKELKVSSENFKSIPPSLTFDGVWNSSREDFSSVREESLLFARELGSGSPLKKLDISIKSRPIFQCIIKELYPNVEELTLSYPSADVLTDTFAHFGQGQEHGGKLKSLSIQFQNYPEKLDSILVGLPHKITDVMKAKKLYKFSDPSQLEKIKAKPSLKDLTGLVTLKIECETPNKYKKEVRSQDSSLSDVVIHHGLIHLKNAQRLTFKGHKFTEEAICKLREEILYFCHLDLLTLDEQGDYSSNR